MTSWRSAPVSLKESLLFAAGSAAAGFPVFMYGSYFSIPPAHRTARMLQTDLLAALGIAAGIGLVGALAFGLAQAWRRRRRRLLSRGRGPWLPVALGGAHLVALLAGLSLCEWLFSLDDVALTAAALALGIPACLSRLGWRDTEPRSVSLDL